MAEVNLFPSDTQPLPRLAWQIIDAARRQCLTGELALDSNPPSRVYLRDGFVYYAERTTDASPGVRLLIEGVITRDQRAKGAVQVNGAEHLGRMFERDSTIDRASAEVCIEESTDEVLQSVAGETVTAYRLTLYKRHASGIDRWYPPTTNIILSAAPAQAWIDDPELSSATPRQLPSRPAKAPEVIAEPAQEPAQATVKIVEAEEVAPTVEAIADEVVVAPVAEVVELIEAAEETHEDEPVVQDEPVADTVADEQPVESFDSDPTDELPTYDEFVAMSIGQVSEPAAEAEAEVQRMPRLPGSPAYEPQAYREPETQANEDDPWLAIARHAETPGHVQTVPLHEVIQEVVNMPVEEYAPAAEAEETFDEAAMTTAIADEVANAVRRALAAIDAASRPVPQISPDDIIAGAEADASASA